MTIEPLPYRNRYANEIAAYRPGIIDRILTRWRKVGKPWDGTHSHAVNWHYDPTSPDDFVCCPYPLPSEKLKTHRDLTDPIHSRCRRVA